MLRINDPLELELRVGGQLGIGDGLHSTRVSLNNKARQAYLQQRQTVADKLRACVIDNAATLLQATTEDDLLRVASASVPAQASGASSSRARARGANISRSLISRKND